MAADFQAAGDHLYLGDCRTSVFMDQIPAILPENPFPNCLFLTLFLQTSLPF
jgi:hypothetical protein